MFNKLCVSGLTLLFLVKPLCTHLNESYTSHRLHYAQGTKGLVAYIVSHLIVKSAADNHVPTVLLMRLSCNGQVTHIEIRRYAEVFGSYNWMRFVMFAKASSGIDPSRLFLPRLNVLAKPLWRMEGSGKDPSTMMKRLPLRSTFVTVTKFGMPP